MSTKKLNPDTVATLSKKLDEFSEVLTADEHAVLLGLIGLASSTIEQSHKGIDTEAVGTENAIVIQPSGSLPKLSTGLKEVFAGMPATIKPSKRGEELMDSIGVGWLCVSWSKDYALDPLKEKILVANTEEQVSVTTIPGLKQFR